MGKALLVLAIGLPLFLGALFLPSELMLMRDELAWRDRTGPFEYLDRAPVGSYERQALMEIDALQRTQGLVSRLVDSRYGDAYLGGIEATRARLSPDGREVLTGTATVARRWNADTGRSETMFGWRQRRDAEDTARWGYGFSEVAWMRDGRGVAAMTSHAPHSIWFFGQQVPGPVVIGNKAVSALDALGERVAFIRDLEYGATFEMQDAGQRGTAAIVRLPHPDVSAIALAREGGVVTASRNLIRWWRDGRQQRELPIEGAYNPAGLSRDAAWVLVPAGNVAELWSTADGRRLALEHDSQVDAICAAGDRVVTGTRDGHLHFWSASDGRRVRTLRAGIRAVDLLDCTQDRLLSVGNNRREARVWDLQGRAQSWSLPEPALPRIGWIATAGANLDLPGRFPALADRLEEWGPDLQAPAVASLALTLALALWLGRARPRNG
ncbi:MAG: WD40 repeat domain-containing protein [bacterium]|jgi:hypothetical protein|nr:hypothetical protein [Betaproteobacteria bacterium]